LVQFEKFLYSHAFSNAVAFGINANSQFYWASSVQFPGVALAREYAIEHCEGIVKTTCKIVESNRDFHEKEFFELALQLKAEDLDTLRKSLIASIKSTPNVTRLATSQGGSAGMVNARIFSSGSALLTTAPTQPSSAPMAISSIAPATSSNNSTGNSFWAARLSHLEQMKGKLTFAKAFAILLNVSDSEELAELVRFEHSLSSYGYSNALAIGTNAKSGIYWAIAFQIPGEPQAREYAIDYCKKGAQKECRVIASNRQFHENEFIEFAQDLAVLDVNELRRSLVESIKSRPREDRVNSSGPTIHARIISPYL